MSEYFTVELDDNEKYEVPVQCPHRRGWLSKGQINRRRGVIICPLHYSKFCIRTGRALGGPACDDLDVRRVKD
ncbi:Rieske (2Fe-2S) protein [Ferruginivarius sediminum]|uniref:(2Fe-2S)-binding protein n=1 Tax=Ferruginivarius sediminum TaxID=2661937 RepID=A0A369TCF1_9PROT|nr:Rieske 2Fe-2S domain-containing protein [Ferruginivarius sediminum]RDD62085.1 (2Fe-2S)-binding protein [Ferruginivarius sediminum]